MKDLELLKTITELPGGSGDEGMVRKFIKERLNKISHAETDGMGNIYASIGQGPRVLAVGHMDEIGFKVASINMDGSINVHNAGFVFPWGMLSQIYNVFTSKGIIKGVISLNPNQKEGGPKSEFPRVEDLKLYVGAHSKEEVEALGIEVGNSVIYEPHFVELENDELLTKAWDNRIGCALSIRALEDLASKDLKITYIGGGTVQEEVGCRGAKALVKHINPDIAFSLDTAPASDEDGSILGKGPQLFVMDSGTLANKKLLEFAKKVAKDNNIPYQLSLIRRGSTDASSFQNETDGIPVLAISVPVKYIHTPVSIISHEDYLNTLKLFEAILLALNEEEVNKIKSFDD